MLSLREMCVENRWKLEFTFWEQDWSLLIAKEIHHLIPLGPNCYLKMIFRDSSRSNIPWVLTYFNAVVALRSAVLISGWDLGLINSWSFAFRQLHPSEGEWYLQFLSSNRSRLWLAIYRTHKVGKESAKMCNHGWPRNRFQGTSTCGSSDWDSGSLSWALLHLVFLIFLSMTF